ncbi:hypothetical protein J2W55_003124 [Mucilaginibacter pocheonensis]|uniref:Uncharacterized protein n=1 Tax=Mucilaginibacter pocheonensis TaxID=398050 RepID=A0ABU1TDF4_9SPHI|nr:hypothetical protein [Mucilaginibacter pocheonensis]
MKDDFILLSIIHSRKPLISLEKTEMNFITLLFLYN